MLDKFEVNIRQRLNSSHLHKVFTSMSGIIDMRLSSTLNYQHFLVSKLVFKHEADMSVAEVKVDLVTNDHTIQ